MGTLMEILCEFPYGNPVGIPIWEFPHENPMGILWEFPRGNPVGILWEFPQKTRGNGMGMGIEIPSPRQPWIPMDSQWLVTSKTVQTMTLGGIV